jgi:hypothetical protein
LKPQSRFLVVFYCRKIRLESGKSAKIALGRTLNDLTNCHEAAIALEWVCASGAKLKQTVWKVQLTGFHFGLRRARI